MGAVWEHWVKKGMWWGVCPRFSSLAAFGASLQNPERPGHTAAQGDHRGE